MTNNIDDTKSEYKLRLKAKKRKIKKRRNKNKQERNKNNKILERRIIKSMRNKIEDYKIDNEMLDYDIYNYRRYLEEYFKHIEKMNNIIIKLREKKYNFNYNLNWDYDINKFENIYNNHIYKEYYSLDPILEYNYMNDE